MFTVAIVDYHCYGTTFNGFERYRKRCRYYKSQKCTKFQNLFCNCLLQSLKFVMRIVQKIQAALVKPCRLESMPNYEIKKAKSREAPFNL